MRRVILESPAGEKKADAIARSAGRTGGSSESSFVVVVAPPSMRASAAASVLPSLLSMKSMAHPNARAIHGLEQVEVVTP
jgi:hypothetical protein